MWIYLVVVGNAGSVFTNWLNMREHMARIAPPIKGRRQFTIQSIPPITGRTTAVMWLMVNPTAMEGAMSAVSAFFLKNELMAMAKLKNRLSIIYKTLSPSVFD